MLNQQIIDVPANRAGLDPYDIVVYTYYGAMVYIGMKQYAKAIAYLRLAFSTSASGVTACLIVAYKKYVLVSLIENGSVDSLPKWTGRIQQTLIQHAVAYKEIKEAFETYKADALHTCIEKHAETFAKDTNMGLVKQLKQALSRRCVKRLTQTYLTLSLEDIANKTGLPSAEVAERTLLEMIENDTIFASINQRDGMVSFLEDGEQYDAAGTVQKLHGKIIESFDVANTVRKLSDNIVVQRDYINKKMQMERPRGGYGIPSNDSMSIDEDPGM